MNVGKMFTLSIGLVSMFFSLNVSAYTTVFNLTLGQTTKSTVKKLYPDLVVLGVSEATNGEVLEIPPKAVKFDGLKYLLILLNDKNKVTAVFLNIDRRKFDFVNASLSSKYKLIRQKKPFVGDKYADYRNGDDIVTLNSPHMSFDMELLYMQKDTFEKINKFFKDKDNKKMRQESSQL